MAVGLMLAGCADSSEGNESSDPDSSANSVIKPAEAPGNWVEHEVAGVRFSTPASWNNIDDSPQNVADEQLTVLAEVTEATSSPGISVAVLGERVSSAEGLSESFAVTGQAIWQADNPVREQITWPGADDAWYVSFEGELVHENVSYPHHIAFLALDVGDDLQVQVNVTAWEDAPEAADIERALQSVVLDDPAISVAS